jgi:hypothetical protein
MNRVSVRTVKFANANRTWHHIPVSAYTAGVGHCTVYHASVVVTVLGAKKSTRSIPQGTLEVPALY